MSTTRRWDSATEHLRLWEFASKAELRRALHQYTALLEGVQVRRYGIPDVGPTPSDPEAAADYEDAVMRWRSTIDLALDQLHEECPRLYRILDFYFRQGLSTEPHGWLVVAQAIGIRCKPCAGRTVRCTIEGYGVIEDNRLGLPKCREGAHLGCTEDYKRWRRQLGIAVDAAWYVIERRQERAGRLTEPKGER